MVDGLTYQKKCCGCINNTQSVFRLLLISLVGVMKCPNYRDDAKLPVFRIFFDRLSAFYRSASQALACHLHDLAPCIPRNFHLNFMMTDITQNWFVTMPKSVKKQNFFPPKVKVRTLRVKVKVFIVSWAGGVISKSDINFRTFVSYFLIPFGHNKLARYDKETCHCR